jgi:hypothetical protein
VAALVSLAARDVRLRSLAASALRALGESDPWSIAPTLLQRLVEEVVSEQATEVAAALRQTAVAAAAALGMGKLLARRLRSFDTSERDAALAELEAAVGSSTQQQQSGGMNPALEQTVPLVGLLRVGGGGSQGQEGVVRRALALLSASGAACLTAPFDVTPAGLVARMRQHTARAAMEQLSADDGATVTRQRRRKAAAPGRGAALRRLRQKAARKASRYAKLYAQASPPPPVRSKIAANQRILERLDAELAQQQQQQQTVATPASAVMEDSQQADVSDLRSRAAALLGGANLVKRGGPDAVVADEAEEAL